MHEGEPGRRLVGGVWPERGLKPVNCCCGRVSISVPSSLDTVDGRPWEEAETGVIAADRRFFNLCRRALARFLRVTDDRYFVDPANYY